MTNELENVTLTRWEPCIAFAGNHTGAAICVECGWLEEEHPVEADVHTLRPRVHAEVTRPKRLAS